jgi:hypothetical protein
MDLIWSNYKAIRSLQLINKKTCTLIVISNVQYTFVVI